MKIQVKPIETKTWHGKTGKESFKRPIIIRALLDTDKMEYATGLDDTVPYNAPDNKEKLTERRYFEKKLNKDLSPAYNPDEPHPVWDGPLGEVKLENNTMFFDDSKRTIDHLKIAIMKASKYVANSMKEYEEGLFPNATHVIFDEEEEVRKASKKVNMRKQAIIQCSKMSRDRKIQMIILLAGKDIKNKSDDFVDVEIDRLIEADAEKVIDFINGDEKKQKVKAVVREAQLRNIVRRNKNMYTYMELKLGYSLEEAADYLMQDENQELYLRLLAEMGG